jgi:hypothetical protein
MVVDATSTTKAASFIALSEVLPKPPLFEHTAKTKYGHKR